MPFTKARSQDENLSLVLFCRLAHAPTIDVLDGCVNNAISLFAELAMSEDGHRQTKPNEEAQDEFPHDDVPASQEEGAFVPDVAKVEEEDVYVDIEEASASRFLKIPALGWFVFFGVMICILAIVFLKVFQSPSLVEETLELRAEILANKKEAEKEDQKVEDQQSTRRLLEQITLCVKGYFIADQIEQKLNYVRQPERVKLLMEKHYQDHPMKTGEFRQFEKYSALDIEGVPFVYAKVRLENGDSHDVLLEQLDDGSFRLDWESHVHYQPITWDEFVRQRPAEPMVMRVAIKPDSFYAYEFRDNQKYDCYQLRARNSNEYIFGYVVKGSELSIQLRQFFMRSRRVTELKAEPMILQLRFPQDGVSKNCVYIERLMAPRWVFAHESQVQYGADTTKTEEP